jgi:hypothetical protein
VKKRRIQEVEPTAKLPGAKAHRKIAGTMLSLQGGGLDADLGGLPSDWDLEEPDAKEAELVKATRNRLTGQMVMRTYAENLSKAFKDNEIEYEWGGKLSPVPSNQIQVGNASLAKRHFDQNKHQLKSRRRPQRMHPDPGQEQIDRRAMAWHPCAVAKSIRRLCFVIRQNRCLCAVLVGVILSASPANAATNSDGPAIRFDSTSFSFGTAMAGDVVSHAFFFTNTGNRTLEIKAVTPSCGCTVPGEWTHRLEPGDTGRIPLELNTSRFAGPVTEVTSVTCNDRARYKVVLSFTGRVIRSLDINPWNVILKPVIDSGVGASNSSEIINQLSDPITIGNPISDNQLFQPELTTIIPGRKFRLTVRSAAVNRATMMHGNISMRTSSAKTPTITVGVLAIPQEPLVVSPTVLELPAGPLASSTNVTISLHNNGRNPLKITQATIDIHGAEVEFKELQPGHEFELTASFSAGFQLPRNREAALTIKLSGERAPLLKVPLRPARPMVSSRTAIPNVANGNQ